MERNPENYKKCHKSIGMTTKSKENVKMYAKYSKSVKRYWPKNVKQLPFFSNSTMIKICVCWILNLDQMQSNWHILFLVLQSNYWMVQKWSKYWQYSRIQVLDCLFKFQVELSNVWIVRTQNWSSVSVNAAIHLMDC